jgi:hypothetical protein
MNISIENIENKSIEDLEDMRFVLNVSINILKRKIMSLPPIEYNVAKRKIEEKEKQLKVIKQTLNDKKIVEAL